MATCIDVASEQLCYVPCKFCNIILAVSVPCNSLFDMVTVRCGHCTNLWSVNMAAAYQSSSSSSWQNHHVQVPNYTAPEYRMDFGSSTKCNMNRMTMRTPITNSVHEERIVNRPPEKRQRVPSAYNQFIKYIYVSLLKFVAELTTINYYYYYLLFFIFYLHKMPKCAEKRFRGSRLIIQISVTGKHLVLLPKIGHTSLTFTLDSCWRATIKPNLPVESENYQMHNAALLGQIKKIFILWS